MADQTVTGWALYWGDDAPHGIYPTRDEAEQDLARASETVRPKLRVVELVEVVRCRDCVHSLGVSPGNIVCNQFGGDVRCEDHYCAEGLREERDHD